MITAGAGLLLPYVDIRIAQARAALGDLDGARAGLEPLVASGVDFGWGLGWTMVQLADVLRLAGDPAGAETRAREALAIEERISSRHVIALSKEVLGLLLAERGDYSEAETVLHEALALRVERELFLNLPHTFDALAEVAAGLQSHEEATAWIRRARGERKRPASG